uniref:Protein kinase domain-containing protein n=1 Tax=Hucho hucho TaxID=62062 RepID=A0A4W5PG38_9TELE
PCYVLRLIIVCDCVCLPTVCEYCSTGDLYTYWLLKGQFGEDEARVFVAELGCALAPEVLSGGPYSHAADWWSLGILLFSLVTGKFPVPPEPDHSNMLRKVRDCPYSMPKTFNPALALLLTEVICSWIVSDWETHLSFKQKINKFSMLLFLSLSYL